MEDEPSFAITERGSRVMKITHILESLGVANPYAVAKRVQEVAAPLEDHKKMMRLREVVQLASKVGRVVVEIKDGCPIYSNELQGKAKAALNE